MLVYDIALCLGLRSDMSWKNCMIAFNILCECNTVMSHICCLFLKCFLFEGVHNSAVVEASCYKPEGHRFETQCGN
jgi:hypothetical protein